jgi:translation initiation factor eIF-2B subunit delta
MNKVSKIMVCGFTMFSNGSMLGTAGTALIAAYGSNFRKPFYVLCESFKFSEKSKIDGLIVNKGVESVIEDKPGTFNRISLTYDLTPQKFISLVVSEIGAMPPSSVSVILREFYSYDTSNIKYVPPSSN